MQSLRIQSETDYRRTYAESIANPEAFWAEQASTFHWQKKWDKVLSWEFDTPRVTWFEGGKLNITENCIDRHAAAHPNKTAIIWEPNDPASDGHSISYAQLKDKVSQCSNALKKQGIQKGDRVCLYMPMIPELAIAVLACARIGAIHSVVFAGFSSSALADRINDAQCKMVITANDLTRGTKTLPLKEIVDEALQHCPSVSSVLVAKCSDSLCSMEEGRDHWLDEVMEVESTNCPATVMDAEDPLFILYTSGSTGKPKGVVHTCGGYMVYTAYSFLNVFQYEENDVYWCTADIGWITGHSYIVYGPLLAGATSVMFEGVPTHPHAGRFWEVCEKHKVNQFYTAPTAIRALMACGDDIPNNYPLPDLKVIGTVGEPINEEAWQWYFEKIGKGNCPVVDTWWQTETGGIMLSSLGKIGPQKPTFAGRPLPGIQPCLVDPEGEELEGNDVEGLLCVKFPWPSMLRTTYGDHERCRNTYFSMYKGYYFTGDGARRDADGHYRVIGRVDDVINVSGHRFGTAEIENAINEHPLVVESAVVGYPHAIKGQGIYAYVIMTGAATDSTRAEIIDVVKKEIGPIAKPDCIQFVEGLPKTRSGKIMRRILRKIASNESDQLGDTSTLLDPQVVDSLIAGCEELQQ